jgi:S1-C subfamily serine protease
VSSTRYPQKANGKTRRIGVIRSYQTIFCVGILSILGTTARADTIPQLVAKTKPAVVQVIGLDQNYSPIKFGTGFFVSPDGLVVTNFHVIQGASHITALSNAGALFLFQKVVAQPLGVDLAVLKFLATDAPFLKLGRSADAVEGQKVLVVGNPQGLQGTVSDGIIASFRDNHSLIQITAPISHGSSGSPVMNENGEVIGVATLIEAEGQNLNFAIPSEQVASALSASAVATPPSPASTSSDQNATPIVGSVLSPSNPLPPTQPDLSASVREFVQSFWNHHESNDASDWASAFAPRTNYCYYSGGQWADPRFVEQDRAKLVKRYPIRQYRFYGLTIDAQPGGSLARVGYGFNYAYAGRKSAAGVCRVSLTLQQISGRWFIIAYDEKVDRQ